MRSLPQLHTLLKVIEMTLEGKPVRHLLSECCGLYNDTEAQQQLIQQIEEVNHWVTKNFVQLDHVMSDAEGDQFIAGLESLCKTNKEYDQRSPEHRIVFSRVRLIANACMACPGNDTIVPSPFEMHLLQRLSDWHEKLAAEQNGIDC